MKQKNIIQKIQTSAYLIIATGMLFLQSCNNPSGSNQHNTAASAFQFKEKLSDYGFFEDSLKALHPRAHVIPYELATPLFTDYAVKNRFIVLPQGKKIRYTATGALDFPDSSIVIKNFAYINTTHQKMMIETRLLVKDPADHNWKVMDYLWNEQQTDAIKHITGAKVPITLLDNDGKAISTLYQVPNTNDCKRCHIKNDTLTLIGPKARNLNLTIAGQNTNQLVQWASMGILESLPTDMAAVAQMPVWDDRKHFSLEQRARAYLDVNCAHCHTKGGDAFNTGLFLEYEQTAPDHIGIMKMPVSAGNGAGGLNYDIVPGDAAHSILPYRMNSTDPNTAMPELARTVIHKEGVKLIVDWINSMPGKK